jgi:hypothetical protein
VTARPHRNPALRGAADCLARIADFAITLRNELARVRDQA